jgi:hypothetical protein
LDAVSEKSLAQPVPQTEATVLPGCAIAKNSFFQRMSIKSTGSWFSISISNEEQTIIFISNVLNQERDLAYETFVRWNALG